MRLWIARTTEMNIVGPMTKEELVKKIAAGELIDSDEVTSGNGYWFWLKEENLLDKYIYGNEEQPFGYVAGDDLPSPTQKEEAILPENSDLQYPSETPDSSHTEATTVINLNNKEQENKATIDVKVDTDLELKLESQPSPPPIPDVRSNNKTKKAKEKREQVKKEERKNLIYLIIVVVMFAIYMLLTSAEAQQNSDIAKKKVTFSYHL